MNLRDYDPASLWNTPGTPPNFGQMPVPHIFTMAGRFSLVSKAYLNADEALLHDSQNAERMRVDCGIMESLGARQRAVALLNWHIESEDSKSFQQKELAEQLTAILQRAPRFLEMRRNPLEATWYGRYGIALQYSSQIIGGHRRIAARRWEPRHGDKLVFRYDDGTFVTDPEEVGIRVGSASSFPPKLIGGRRKIEPTEQGWVYWLSPCERKTIVVHKHLIEDAPYDDPRAAGRIHGVGIRSRIYWTWYAMVECLQRALEFLDRSALGVEIWTYPANNAQAKLRTEEAALNHVGGGRSVVMVPVFPGENADLYGVRHIEPGLAGIDALLNVIKEYFGHKIKRYIIGQTLTSEADATGLGSGVADAHLATFADICQYDARNLEETLTTDFLRPLQLWNFPKSAGHHLRIVIDTDEPIVEIRISVQLTGSNLELLAVTSDTIGKPLAFPGYSETAWPIPTPFDSNSPAGIFACYLQSPCMKWHGIAGARESITNFDGGLQTNDSITQTTREERSAQWRFYEVPAMQDSLPYRSPADLSTQQLSELAYTYVEMDDTYDLHDGIIALPLSKPRSVSIPTDSGSVNISQETTIIRLHQGIAYHHFNYAAERIGDWPTIPQPASRFLTPSGILEVMMDHKIALHNPRNGSDLKRKVYRVQGTIKYAMSRMPQLNDQLRYQGNPMTQSLAGGWVNLSKIYSTS